MQVGNICTRMVISAAPQTSLGEISNLMKEKEIGAVVITEANQAKILGILTDRDLAVNLAKFKEKLHETTAEQIMHKEVLTLQKAQDLKEALIAMRKRCVRRAPVVDQDNKLVGIITLDDIVSACAETLCEIEHLIKHQTSFIKCCEC